MKYPGNLFIISMAVFGAYFARGAIAAQNAPTTFSTYGLIQPVNKYSSNPFWNVDSPYNQRMPVPIYATGADLNTGDCNRVVETLVATYCASHNYCTDSRINDIRPSVMVQLSQLPGHNFATSCGGYIDSVFENYQKTYGNVSAGTVHYTTTPTLQHTTTTQYKNPFKSAPNEYQSGVMERSAELDRLQRITTTTPEVSTTDFPKTIADMSFTERLANTTVGYEPYKDLNPYKTPQFESDEEYYERLKKLNPSEYCKRFPSDVETCSKKITYQLFGGTNAADNPKYYIPGQGATISGIPTRNNSIFVSWCTNSALTNCASTQVISKSENTDKTFFAKWGCTNGYVLQNNYCVNPSNPNGDSGSYVPQYPGSGGYGCPDIHMDTNCQCTGNYAPNPNNPNTCICANGLDITTYPNCERGTTDKKPQCIRNIENDSDFKTTIHTQLTRGNITNNTEFDAWLRTNKLNLYNTIATEIEKHCLRESSNSALAEFNSFLDTNTEMSITLENFSVSLPIVDLFDYVKFPTAILVYNNRGFKPAQQILRSNLDNSRIFFTAACSDHIVLYHVDSSTGVNIAGHNTNFALPFTNKHKFFLDFPDEDMRTFPGLLIATFRNIISTTGETVVVIDNYLDARQKLKVFTDSLQNTNCQGGGLASYLVYSPKIRSGAGFWVSPIFDTKIDFVRIMDGPLVIR